LAVTEVEPSEQVNFIVALKLRIRVCDTAQTSAKQREHSRILHVDMDVVVYISSLEQDFDSLERNDEAEHSEHCDHAVHVADGEVREVYACVYAEEVEKLVEYRRHADVPQHHEAAADKDREELHVDVERQYVAKDQRADLVRRVTLCLFEVAAHRFAYFEDVHENQQHADVCERRGAVVLHEVEHEVDVGGCHGLHENLETRQDLPEKLVGHGRARTRDKGDAQDEKAGAVSFHETLNGVREYVEKHIRKVVLHFDVVEENGDE